MEAFFWKWRLRAENKTFVNFNYARFRDLDRAWHGKSHARFEHEFFTERLLG